MAGAIPGNFFKMKKAVILLALLFVYCSANGQWRKVADFVATQDGQPDGWHRGEPVTCIYFIDLPGPPRIGFVGTESSLYKTTDGGQRWFGVWDTGVSYDHDYISGICFKDSLIGWFSVSDGYNPSESCYRTTDGGQTWNVQYFPATGNHIYDSWPAHGVYYNSISGRLFLSCHTMLRISTDLGLTWTDSLPYFAYNYSFASPLRGIVETQPTYFVMQDTFNPIVYLTTSDGGVTWDTAQAIGFTSKMGPNETLAIPGTTTCFGISAGWKAGFGGEIWRSDDFGKTWRAVGDLPMGAQDCSGYIAGDFTRLYAQTDSAMYVSTDSGVTWINDGGPGIQETDVGVPQIYASKGVTFAGMIGFDTNAGVQTSSLWEGIWPQSGVTPSAIPAGPEISVYPNPTSGVVTIRGATDAVVVTNVLGEEVLRLGKSDEDVRPTRLDLSGLPAGTYFVRVSNQSGSQVLKVLKGGE